MPRLLGIPADARVECDAVPVATGILGEDDCDPLPALVADEKRADGACLFSYDLKRSWTVTDRCGLSADAAQQIEVRDTTAPLIAGVPPSTIVECDSVPPVAPALASDNCDPTPALAFAESRAPGSCPQNFILTREWLARDVCGNKTPATQTIDARDRTGPAISGVPPGATVACNAVPPPASPVAGDNCDPAPRLVFAEDRTDGSCPGNYSLKRTWTANDQCANSTFATQVVTVQDLTPPVIAGGNHEQYCLWPPNHRYVCFDRGDFAPLVSDDCSEPLTWRLAGCRSNQPDDADESDRGGPWSGDGRTRDDCTVSRDGERICVRAERAGSGPGAAAGRQYDVTIIATDACGNESAAVSIGHIRVPHDRRATDDRCR